MKLTFRSLTAEDALNIASWHYDDPYSMYNVNSEEPAEVVAWFTDPANGYVAIDIDSQFAGFYCTGEDAQVPGGDYSHEDALDIGMGMRPDLTGKGLGHIIITSVLEQVAVGHPFARYRATVAAFNARALRLCEQAGFRPQQRFHRNNNPADREFIVLATPPLAG